MVQAGLTADIRRISSLTVSPKIGMGIDITSWRPRSRRPLDKLRAAARQIEAQGLVICLDCDHGVGRHEHTGNWLADGRHVPRRVSIAGAVCLALQPVHGLHVEEAAAAALEVSWDWFLGVLDGWGNDPQTVLLEGASQALYRDGVRCGHLLFAELTVECPDCGVRIYHQDGERCRDCRTF
jgi:hypothetical protein